MTEKPTKLELVGLPISVGNPPSAADFAIDQSHMEEFAMVDEGPAEVTCAKPPKGVSSPCVPKSASPTRIEATIFCWR